MKGNLVCAIICFIVGGISFACFIPTGYVLFVLVGFSSECVGVYKLLSRISKETDVDKIPKPKIYFPCRGVCHTCGRYTFILYFGKCSRCVDYKNRYRRIGKKPLT